MLLYNNLNCLFLSCPQHVEVWWWIHRLEFGVGFITFLKSSALAFFLVNDLHECHFKCFTGSQSTDKLFFAAGFEERFCIRCSTFQRNVFSDGYWYEKLQTIWDYAGRCHRRWSFWWEVGVRIRPPRQSVMFVSQSGQRNRLPDCRTKRRIKGHFVKEIRLPHSANPVFM